MAGLTPGDTPAVLSATEAPVFRPPSIREQIAALAKLRWIISRNSLRTLHGRLELISTIFTTLGLSVAWLGMGVGLGIAAWYLASHGYVQWLPALFWLVFVFWQFFPIVTTAMAVSFDATNLLRFPIAYSSYFLLNLAYGCADPISIAATYWLCCIGLGCVAADPVYLWTALPVVILFAALNLLLGRALMAWMDRWLAQRRTREIMGFLFFFLLVGFQLIGPIVQHWRHLSGSAHTRIIALLPFERLLPPGLAADALIHTAQRDVLGALLRCIALLAYVLLFALLFAWRLRAQYRGENLSESAAPSPIPTGGKRSLHLGWRLKWLSPPVAAAFEKEVRSLSRSGPMLLTLFVPLLVLFIFRMRVSAVHHAAKAGLPVSSNLLSFIFPIGAAYALLILTNLIYNSLGSEGPGIQFYFVAPIRFQSVLQGKNLAYSIVMLIDLVTVWIGVRFLYQPPSIGIVLSTLLAVAFALQSDLAIGNVLSLYFPKKYDMAVFGRNNTSRVSALLGLVIQALIFGIAGFVFFLGFIFHRPWLTNLILLFLVALAFIGYRLSLNACNRIASDRREALAAELCRAA